MSKIKDNKERELKEELPEWIEKANEQAMFIKACKDAFDPRVDDKTVREELKRGLSAMKELPNIPFTK